MLKHLGEKCGKTAYLAKQKYVRFRSPDRP